MTQEFGTGPSAFQDTQKHAPGRVPKHDLDAEAALLSALMLDPDAAWPDVSAILTRDDFYSPANRLIYDAVGALSAAGTPVDALTVQSWLKARERLAEVGGDPYLARIIDKAPGLAMVNVVAYAKAVLACSRQRQAVALHQRLAAEGYGDVGDVDEWLQRADGEIHSLASGSGSSAMSYKPFRDVLRTTLQGIEASWRDGCGTKRILTGLPSLDEKLSMMEGDLIIVGARPGMGKTAFIGGMTTFAVNSDLWPEAEFAAWKGEQIGAALHTQEMSSDQIAMRLLCSEAKVDLSAIRRGHVGPGDWPLLSEAVQRLSPLPLWIDAKPGVSLDHIRKNVRALKRECERRTRETKQAQSLRLVVIDYLGLMKLDGRKGATKSEFVGDVTRGLKQLAGDEGVVVVLLAQLNRGLESRDNKRPVLSDLRDSGEIEQDADSILFLYRHGYYQKDYRQDLAEIIIAKQRNGPPERVLVKWTGAHTLFSELSDREKEDLRDEAMDEARKPKAMNGGKKW